MKISTELAVRDIMHETSMIKSADGDGYREQIRANEARWN